MNLINPNSSVTGTNIDHCYSDIGCFPLSDEFYHPKHRPFNVRPWHRRHIRTQFELFNSKFPEGHLLKAWNRLNLISSGFDPRLETKIIVPGWLDNIDRVVWIKQLRDALLWLWQPTNIIVVRWRNFTPYTIATANTRVVGAELANLIKFIEHELGYDRSYYHLIGHSLGAHIGGYCGDRIHGLGRITALDPARPFFQGMPKSVRLDRGDAKFIDAIHSDFTPENAIFLLMSFGMTTPVGHVDFYPNGPPLLQPGCLRDTLGAIQRGIIRGLQYNSLSIAFLESVRYMTACDHQRSHEWFVESVINRECVFVGVRCNEYEGMINGRCTCDDSPSACAIMGIHADQMYLNNAHEDLWPVKTTRPSATPPLARPTNSMIHQQASLYERPRQELYAQLKLEATRIRHKPQEPQAMLDVLYGDYDGGDDLPALVDQTNEILENHEDQEGTLKTLEDLAFLEYLRTTLLLDPTLPIQAPPTVPLNAPGLLSHGQEYTSNEIPLDRRQDTPDSHGTTTKSAQITIERRQSGLMAPENHLNLGHPQLLSDMDRNIENWYEGNSRWYLKTNNRPNYCSNQYQLLVFVGPLRARNGRDRLRANLLISIIGTRGQLLRQRFVPRSASLDSYTMQPFFILLEGSYSLGQIQSVAIAWEARNDPDPIQATVSFQNNRLANMEMHLPALTAKHPWLAETIKYDRSQGFQWRQPDESVSQYYGRRQDDDDHVTFETIKGDRNGFGRRAGHMMPSKSCKATMGATLRGIAAGASSSRQGHCTQPRLEKRNGVMADDQSTGYVDYDDLDYREDDTVDDQQASSSILRPNIFVGPSRDVEEKESSFLEPIVDPAGRLVDEKKALNSDRQISIDFHNIDLQQDTRYEDSIVVSQIILSPLEASYGRAGRTAKTFCPPRFNRRLAHDQTLRLTESLASRCHHQGFQPVSVR